MKTKETFTWYAAHPIDGELILAIWPKENFKYGMIYCPRIIAERLRPRWKCVYGLELSLGPFGFIPAALYEEAGFNFRVPFKTRMIALTDSYTHDFAQKHDQELTEFIIESWKLKKVYNPD